MKQNPWDQMEDDLLKTGNSWSADYSEGYNSVNIPHGEFTVEFRQNKFWVNDRTGERISAEEHDNRYNNYPKRDSPALESFTFAILDFGK